MTAFYSGDIGGSLTGVRSDPASMVRQITPTANGSTSSTNVFAEGPCRAITAASSGTITYYDHTTTLVSSFPVKAFDNPIGARQILSTGSTLTTVAPPTLWALY
jgi:hypothetical protein